MWIECYDYATANRWFFWPLLIGLPICVTCMVILVEAIKKKSEQGCGLLLLCLFAGFSLFWVVGVGYDLISINLKYRAILTDRQYASVEGPIEHFSTYYDKKWSITYDTFLVGQVRVSVDSLKVRAVPAVMDSTGQTLADGRWVKVYYAPAPRPAATDFSQEAMELRRWANSANYRPVILKIWVRSDGK